MLNRPIIKSDAEILYKIPAFRVSIFLPDSIKGIVSDEAIRNKLELALRRNRIKMDDAASVGLALNVNALWNEGKTFASTTISLSVVDSVTLARTGDLRSAFVPVYNDLQFGYAGSLKLKEQVMGAVDELAETFANKHLATQEKENQPTPAR
jgi:hypothetical protein